MEEKETIRRLYFIEGWSMRRIARERRHSRYTVRRALEHPGPPAYRREAPRSRPVLGRFLSIIERWLEEDQQRPPNVMVRGYVDRVEIAAGERVVATHRRCDQRGQDALVPYHYVPALLRKPRAFHQARAVRRYPWPGTFLQALAFLEERHLDGRGVKEFLRILALKDEVGERRLSEALELALRYRCVGADAVRHLLHQMETTWQPPLPLDAVPLELDLKVPVRDLSQYNLLLSRS